MYTCILANLQYTYMICIQKMTMYACIHLIYHDSMSRLAEKFFHLWENWAQVGPYDGAHLPFGNPKNPLVIVEFAMSRRRQIPHNMYMCRYIMVYICHYLCICVYLNIYIYIQYTYTYTWFCLHMGPIRSYRWHLASSTLPWRKRRTMASWCTAGVGSTAVPPVSWPFWQRSVLAMLGT